MFLCINFLFTSYYRIEYGFGNSMAQDVGFSGLQLETPHHGFQLEEPETTVARDWTPINPDRFLNRNPQRTEIGAIGFCNMLSFGGVPKDGSTRHAEFIKRICCFISGTKSITTFPRDRPLYHIEGGNRTCQRQAFPLCLFSRLRLKRRYMRC